VAGEQSSNSAIVIGAGIVGVCAGLELQARGLDVTIVDKLDPGEACSFGNAGILAAQSYVPQAVPGVIRKVPGMLFDKDGPLVVRWGRLPLTLPWLMRFYRNARLDVIPPISDALRALYSTTLEMHETLAKAAGVPELVQPSKYLYLFRNPANADVENGLAWRLRRERGSQIEVFDGADAIREIEPSLAPIYKRAVRLGPIGRTTNPFRLTQAYGRLFADRGGKLFKGQVTGIRPGTTVTVDTTRGALQAKCLVVAAGSWTRDIIKPLGFDFPLIAERGYHMTFADPGITLNHSISEGERYFAVNSMEVGMRVAGTEELGHADDPPAWRRAEVLGRMAQQMFPSANFSKPSKWMGPRPGTPDTLPVIGPVPGHPNIIIACGHGHLGLTGGPMTGRIVAGLATGERMNIDIGPYAADRFGKRRGSDKAQAA
jgi:D-amino-acid dehydrogenase